MWPAGFLIRTVRNAGLTGRLVAALADIERLEQRRDVIDFLTRGRRGATDEVENLAVSQPVIGKTPHLAVPVEIDRDHALIDNLVVHEGDRTLGALGDVIEDLAVERGDRGWGSHHDQHLVLARADRNLFKRAWRQDVALLELFAAAADDSAQQGRRGRGSQTTPAEAACKT